MRKTPPYLQRGDAIGIVAPAGYMSLEKMQACIGTLEEWGYNVVLGATAASDSHTYFSGSDEERLTDLQSMLDNPDIRCILCARGGYGTSRILDRINFRSFRRRPKWIVGFSDITALHAHLYQNYRIPSIHGPMAAAFNEDAGQNRYLQSLRDALEGRPTRYEVAPHTHNREGMAEGVLVGGNLALIAHGIGTASDLPTRRRILFIEDVGEYLYSIDRLMLQLRRAGKLEKLAGLIVGGFTDCKDTERPFGKEVYDIIQSHAAEYAFPVSYGFPVSHARENLALKIGLPHRLEIYQNRVLLHEN